MKKTFLLCALLALAAACEGPEGPVGQTGAQGPRGPPGQGGVSLTTTIYCPNTVNVDPARGLIVGMAHTVYLFSDTSVMAYCELGTGTIGGSGFALYKSTQVGAEKGACQVRYDLNNNTAGFWTFEVAGVNSSVPTSKATYVDPESAYNGYSYTTNCTKS